MPSMVGKRFTIFGFVPIDIVGIQIAQRFFISDFFLPSWIRLQSSGIENRLRSVVNAIHGGQAFYFFLDFFPLWVFGLRSVFLFRIFFFRHG